MVPLVLGCVLALLVTTTAGRGVAHADAPSAPVAPISPSAVAGFGISADELRLHNAARAMAGKAPMGPVAPEGRLLMDSPDWRTSNSFKAAWAVVGQMKTPYTFYRWLESIKDAFGRDASDFEKASTILMLVPIVGDALGVARSAMKQDPGGVVVNLLYLLSGVASKLGLSGASLALGVVAFVAWVVVNIVASFKFDNWTDVGSLVKKRDKAWQESVTAAFQDKTVVELVGAAERLFAEGREKVLLNAHVAMAMIDQQARETTDGGAEVAQAAREAKQQVVADTEKMLQALRGGFVKGAHEALDVAFAQLNEGEGSAEFTRTFMAQRVRSQWMDMYVPGWSCDHRGLSPDEASKCFRTEGRRLAVDGLPTPGIQDAVQRHGVYSPEAEREFLSYFDDVVVGEVVANVPRNKFTAEQLRGYHAVMDDKIAAASGFALTPVRDVAAIIEAGVVVDCADNATGCETGATPAPVPTAGATASIKGAGSGRCIDVKGGKFEEGAQAEIWDCHGKPSQLWTSWSTGELRVFDKLCLDAYDRGTTPGTRVIVWWCNGQPNQQWVFQPDGTIKGVQSGLCLDVERGRKGRNTKLLLWTCHAAANQRWTRV
ncbi:lectin [Saccharothrix mutabilis subsp. capreolus]|uniref:RICIN domain-containing protein n=1 Tax=Saccharothrix mutabilis TaxID=33921 RepID=UPI0035E973F2